MADGPVPKPAHLRRRRNKSWIEEANAVSSPPASERPKLNASTATWALYARTLGHTVPPDASRASIIEQVDAGLTGEEAWHPMARDWYRSLSESGQSRYYQPSDWQTARVLAEMLSKALSSGRVTAALMERWQVGATELLTTEGARRRMHLELERTSRVDPKEEAAVARLDDFRRRYGSD